MYLSQKRVIQWWWGIWAIFFLTCVGLWVYNVMERQASDLVNMEYCFYGSILCLAAISISPIQAGKSAFYLLVLALVFCLYDFPEFRQINALKDCFEDHICEDAMQMHLVKQEDGKIVYIPQSDQ